MKNILSIVVLICFFSYTYFLKHKNEKLTDENLNLKMRLDSFPLKKVQREQIETPSLQLKKQDGHETNTQNQIINLKKYLKTSSLEVLSITPNKLFPSIYELKTKSNQIAYIDKDARYLFLGPILDLETMEDQNASSITKSNFEVVYNNHSIIMQMKRTPTQAGSLNATAIRVEPAGKSETLKEVCKQYFP